ncbi:unnamed protein product [Clavelina lepadiformis]|uniref:Transmembrane protein 60 n=1 Tax=Clavelina lepadiformis TaxID=159417 RepID=A0ABP0F171_CLALP
MSLIQQLFFIWIWILIFLILMALKLDNKLQVMWFVVFIPCFILDGVQLLIATVRVIRHCRNGSLSRETSIKRKIWNYTTWICFLLFQVFLCAKLDDIIPEMKLHFAFIPLWIVLVGYLIDLFRFQLRIAAEVLRQYGT